MANFNRVILAGNLTRDPQLSTLPSGTSVVEFGLAVNRKWRDQRSNEMREDTCFVDLRAFGRQAETLNQYMNKGKPLLVEGKLRYDQWEAKDGGRRSKLYVVVDNFQFLGAPGRAGGPADNRGTAPDNRGTAPVGGSAYNDMPPIDAPTPGGDDVPF